MPPSARPTRRDLLKAGAAAAAGVMLPGAFDGRSWGVNSGREKLPVAAVVTVYHQMSHADVLVGKILEGWQQDGGPGPDLRLASLYVDQIGEGDLSRGLAEKHGFRLARTIDEAVTLGTDQVQVAGVLSIGEHGDYPTVPETGQVMYPRRRFFDEIAAAFRRCGRAVPTFNDKHLSYRWEDAKHMFDTARAMDFPLIAGSSVPVAWRYPQLQLPRDSEIEAALTIGYSGLESYGFHTLEAHQAMIERRLGGETGLASVQAVTGENVALAEAAGDWSGALFAAALRQMPGSPSDSRDWISNPASAAFLLRHRDGLKSACIMANGLAAEFAFAAKLVGREEPVATWFKLQPGAPFGHFAYLLRAIEHTIHTGQAAYPAERTLLTSGALDRVMQSQAQGGKLLETPELEVVYEAADWPYANHPDSPLTLPSD